MAEYSVPLEKIIKEFSLETLYMPDGEVLIESADINRPGLPLAGFFGYFDNTRIQVLGKTEYGYLSTLDSDSKKNSLDALFSRRPVAVILTHGLKTYEETIETAKKHKVPLLSSEVKTSEFMAAVISYLNVELAPRITRHGVLVEVYGEGILILGDSGVGKSETAIELVKRGHRLIADDAVEIKKVSSKSLVGSAPEIIRHYVELRGIGIVDVCRIFGMGAVKDTEKIEMIVKFEHWEQGKTYDRFGLETEYTDIMGIQIPTTTIPIKPGRNLAVILEIAAMNFRQKKMGYDTAVEFNNRLMGLGMKEE